MPIIQIKERKSINQLDDSLLKTLYEDVLLFCETEEKLISNNTRSTKWKEFVKSNQLQLVYNHKVEKGMFKLQKTNNIEHVVIDSKYTKQDILDTIVFISKKNRVFTSLFSHIRNAFAHNQIFIEDEYVIMYDRLNQDSSVFTMIAHIKIDVLKELIKTIKSIKN